MSSERAWRIMTRFVYASKRAGLCAQCTRDTTHLQTQVAVVEGLVDLILVDVGESSAGVGEARETRVDGDTLRTRGRREHSRLVGGVRDDRAVALAAPVLNLELVQVARLEPVSYTHLTLPTIA